MQKVPSLALIQYRQGLAALDFNREAKRIVVLAYGGKNMGKCVAAVETHEWKMTHRGGLHQLFKVSNWVG